MKKRKIIGVGLIGLGVVTLAIPGIIGWYFGELWGNQMVAPIMIKGIDLLTEGEFDETEHE